MTKTLDVLLIESQPGDGGADADRLEAAGHRVHRCRSETGDPPGLGIGRLCVGVTDLSCPLDGGIDVALLVRSRVAPQPLGSEAGASCALRAGLPLIEDGPTLLDPFEPWLTGRTGDDIAASCEDAAQRCDRLRALIRYRLRRVLFGAGVDVDDVEVDFVIDHSRLAIHLRGPVVSSAVQEALSVRVFDAVRISGRTFSHVDVSYHLVGP